MDRCRQLYFATQSFAAQRPATLKSRVALAIASCLISVVAWQPNTVGAAVTAQTTASISELIAKLDSNSYDIRKQATLALIDTGVDAAVPVVQAIKNGSREVMMRGIHVLGQQARSDDAQIEQTARAALQRVVQFDDTSAVIHATSALDSVNAWRQANAIVELRRLGADTAESVPLNRTFAPVQRLINRELFISDGWRGQPQDLKQLRWLTDMEQLYVSGKQIGDEHMQYIAQAPNLTSLILERTSVSEEGLAHLKSMPKLSSVDIQYTTISDAGVEHLVKIENLFRVGLKGTKISKLGERRLLARVGSNLELHRGALLGVEADPISAGQGCPVRNVTPNSSAEKAGIRPQDIITAIDGEKIDSFNALKELMAKRSGGEEVDIKFRRGTEVMTTKATLGEWQLFNRSGFQPTPKQRPTPQRPFRQLPQR